MSNLLQVLIVEDSESDAAMIVRLLSKAGYDVQVERVEDAEQMQTALEKQPWDVVISDYSLPQFDAPAALALLQQSRLDIPFIVVSGTVGEATAVAMMKAGAHDYLMKDNLARLAPAVAREMREAQSRQERRQAEEALRKSEERYRTVADYTYDWEYWIGPDGQWLYCSPSCERITGYPAKQFLDRPAFFSEIVHPDDRPILAHHLTQTKNPAQVENVDFRIICRDGTIRWFNHVCQPVWGQNGQWLGRRASNRDITERKQTENALRESEMRYRLIADHVHDIVWQMDKDLRFVYISPAVEHILGYSPEEVYQLPVTNLLNAESIALMQRVIQSRLTGSQEDVVTPNAYKLRHKDGHLVDVEVVSSPIFDQTGQLWGFAGITRDITERKQLEAKNEQLAAQFYQAQKIESIGRLAGGIAHDFNNLLIPIIGYTELGMLTLSSDSPLYTDLKRIKNAGDRAAGLTRQILAFSRQQVLEMKSLDLNRVISEFEPMLRRLIGEDIDLQLHLAADLPCLKADKGQLEQILLNLAVNARDAMPDGGALIIETAQVRLDKAYVAKHSGTQLGPYALLVVSDTGHGMSTAVQQRIFEPFFTTKEQGKGTGLGLATVFGIVKQHEGNIWVYSEPGLGTSFRIYLPLVATPASVVEPEPSDPHAFEGVETVLLVEDETDVRDLVADTLRTYGYQVLEADKPEKGLALAATHQEPIHLLVTDVIMPQMRGPEVAKRVAVLHPQVKVLYMSGYTNQTIAHHGVLQPGQFFLQKPFNLNDLMHKIRKILDNGSF